MSGLLLLALFMLAPQRTVLVFAALSTIGAWEWAAFGGLHGGAARFAYAGAIALLLLLSWLWTGDPQHLLMLLGGACLWWAIAFLWLVLAPERHQPGLALLCGVPVLVPAFVALSRLAIAGNGFVRGPKLVLWLLLLVIGADIGAYFRRPHIRPAKTRSPRESRQDLGGRHRRPLRRGAGRRQRGT